MNKVELLVLLLGNLSAISTIITAFAIVTFAVITFAVFF